MAVREEWETSPDLFTDENRGSRIPKNESIEKFITYLRTLPRLGGLGLVLADSTYYEP
jgi:hypothetical protein